MAARRCVILSCAHAFHTWINLTGLAIHSLQILCVTVSVGLHFAFIYAAVHTHHAWTSFFVCVYLCACERDFSNKHLRSGSGAERPVKGSIVTVGQWHNFRLLLEPCCSCPAKQQSLHESHFSYDWLVPPLANSTIPGLMAPVSGHLHAEG